MTCSYCDRKVLLFPDLNKGQVDLSRTTSTMTCPGCKREFVGALEHYKHTCDGDGKPVSFAPYPRPR